MSRMVSLVVLVAILIAMAIVFFDVMSSFILPIFLALLLVVMFRPLNKWIVRHFKGHVRVAAGLTTVCILLIALLPMVFVLWQATAQAMAFYAVVAGDVSHKMTAVGDVAHKLVGLSDGEKASDDKPALPASVEEAANKEQATADEPAVAAVKQQSAVEGETAAAEPSAATDAGEQVIDADQNIAAAGEQTTEAGKPANTQALDAVADEIVKLSGKLRLKFTREDVRPMLTDTVLPKLKSWLAPLALSTTQFAVRFIVGLCIMVVAVYYFLADGPAMVEALMRLSPLDTVYVQQLIDEFDKSSRAVVLATLVSAVAQGVLAGVGYYFSGLESVFLLMFLTMLMAMIPFIGSTGVWLPVCLWLYFYDGQTAAAIGLFVYGAVVVSLVDNVLKPFILHGSANLHPLLALLSVLGGVEALGPIGIFVGPMVVCFMQALLVMLQKEIVKLQSDDARKSAAPATNA